MALDDQQLRCKDCGQVFAWPESEQRLFESLGFAPPIRCRECRRINRARHDARRAREAASKPWDEKVLAK